MLSGALKLLGCKLRTRKVLFIFYFHLDFESGFWKRLGASNLVGGIATNKITAIGSGSAEAEAVEAALKPTASKTLIKTQNI